MCCKFVAAGPYPRPPRVFAKGPIKSLLLGYTIAEGSLVASYSVNMQFRLVYTARKETGTGMKSEEVGLRKLG
jgi:hypothetical protein